MAADRYSRFHRSLNRPRLLMGVEKGAFGVLTIVGSFAFASQSLWGIPIVIISFMIARWLSKIDDKFVQVFLTYIKEEHVYDAIPRASDHMTRPRGWGRGIPR